MRDDKTAPTMMITDEDREYASELLADLASPDLPRLEIAARWFRKARVETALAARPQCEVQSRDAEAGDGTWQELMDLAALARARAHHHFLNSKTHDLFIECAERLEAIAPTTASPVPSAEGK